MAQHNSHFAFTRLRAQFIKEVLSILRTLDVVLNRLSRGAFHPPKPTMVSLDELPEVLAEGVPASGLVRTIVTP